MEERKIKAYGFNATMEFIEKNYDDDKRKQILSELSPAAQGFINGAQKAQWAPPEYSSELWKGIARQHAPAEATEQLLKAGRYQGAYATNTYLKLLMKMLTMKMFAKKFPDIWSRDANFGKVILGDLNDISSGRLRITFRELGKFPYFGPITQGWFSYSFEVMGLKGLKVELQDWSIQNPDPGELTYQVSWTR
jgi:hypothetical protein